MTSGGSFTASTRINIPASVGCDKSGLESDEKMSMILSIGDGSFASRFNAPTYSSDTLIQSCIKDDGTGWMTATTSGLVSSVFDSWREVSTVYDADVRTLAIFLDG